MNINDKRHSICIKWIDSEEGLRVLNATGYTPVDKLIRAFKAGQEAENERIACAAAKALADKIRRL